ncbi:MAG: hypothetical protein H8D78_17110 [Chloroflexi bacterium]|nr:hypothetical protein [Chloroflexota bacterium]
MMSIGLFDEGSDLRLPNLAILKLATYWRGQEAQVVHNSTRSRFDLACVSIVFRRNALRMLALTDAVRADGWWVGGTGSDIFERLPAEVEACRPDYSLAPAFPHSLGFTVRGCIRRCPWCLVWRAEGNDVWQEATYRDLLRPDHGAQPHVIDLANNILAWSGWEELFQELLDLRQETGLTVDLNQGFDHRLIDADVAQWLARLPLYVARRTWAGGWRRRRAIRLALDDSSETTSFQRAAALLVRAGIPPRALRVYVLEIPGQEEDGLARVREVLAVSNGTTGTTAQPFVMPLDGYRDNGLARWVNRGLYRHVPWEKYARRRALPLSLFPRCAS